jgi:SAM-dependent methyltransferase
MSDPGDHVSPHWARWRHDVDLDEYEARFIDSTAHGEADCLEAFGLRRILDAGCGTGRVAIELANRGLDVTGIDFDDDLLARVRRAGDVVRWVHGDLATMQLELRFELIAMPGNVMVFCRPDDRAVIVSRCVAHLEPGGLLVAGFSASGVGYPLPFDEYDALCAAAGLVLDARWATWERDPHAGGDYAVSVHRLVPVASQSGGTERR